MTPADTSALDRSIIAATDKPRQHYYYDARRPETPIEQREAQVAQVLNDAARRSMRRVQAGQRPAVALLMATLTIGSLEECPSCDRRKREPGARTCGDCVTVGHVYGRHGEEVDRLFHLWARAAFMGHEHLTPAAELLADGDYRKFADLGEFLHAYHCWTPRR